MKPACLAFVFALSLTATVASAQSSAFTYQGELRQNGIPANGSFDIGFELWNAEVGGGRIGNLRSFDAEPVVDRKFTVEIAWGADDFTNADRWIQVFVNGIALTPRQHVTRTPYAIQTRGIFVDEGGSVRIGGQTAIEGFVIASALYIRGGVFSVDSNGEDLEIENPIDGGDISFWLDRDDGASFERLTIKPDGKVGIGTSVPDFLLHVDGTAGKPGGGSWSVASDVRLKKNIEPINDALGTLLRLRGITFEYIDPDAIHELSGQRIGMIAQEVEKVVPDWVNVRSDGYKTVTPRGFEAMTVEALRQLRVEKNDDIKTLRAEKDSQIASLRTQHATQAAQISELKLINEQSREQNSQLRSRLEILEKIVQQLTSNEPENK